MLEALRLLRQEGEYEYIYDVVRFIKTLIYFREIVNTFCPEVLFRSYHVTHLPNKEYQEWNELPRFHEDTGVRLRDVPVEVNELCHVTHNQPASKIDQGNYFIFKPNKKIGKAGYNNYDGSTIGETFVICEPTDQPPTEETKYHYIDPNDPDDKVFPGYYIWWSIDRDRYPPPPPGHYYSHFFTSYSRYGNVKFSGYITKLLRCYQEAYNINPLPHIQFRCGGTLRYDYEICKVVIVCTEIHYPQPQEDFPVMWEGHDIRYDRNGEILFIKRLDIVIRNVVSKKNDKFYSWDTYGFAFYFPDDTYELLCPTSEMFECSIVHHNDELCTKTQPDPNNGGKFTCPNNLPS